MRKYYSEIEEYDLEDEAWLDIQIDRKLYENAKLLSNIRNISLNSFIEIAINEKIVKEYLNK